MCPIYQYRCPEHGDFELLQPMHAITASICPTCGLGVARVMSVPAKVTVTYSEKLPYGNKSRGKIVHVPGGDSIFVPSWGALEKEEVDYVAEGAVEKEKERVRKGKVGGDYRASIDSYMKLAAKTPKGKKGNAIREAMKEKVRTS